MLATIRPRPEGDLWLAQAGVISPVLLFNPNQVRETWRALQNALPKVTLYYAVKPNSYHSLLATLVDEGAAFDEASAPEIQALLPFGVSTNRMIHTHPIKTEHDLETSVRLGVTSFVVDNLDEPWKIVPYRHDITVMLRLAFVAPDARSICRVSSAHGQKMHCISFQWQTKWESLSMACASTLERRH